MYILPKCLKYRAFQVSQGFSEAASPRRFGGVTNAYPVENQELNHRNFHEFSEKPWVRFFFQNPNDMTQSLLAIIDL